MRNEKRQTENAKRATSHQPRATIAILIASAWVTVFAQAPAPAGNSQNGRKLFAANGCYQCHGYEAQGATPTGPRLGPRPLGFAAFVKYVRQPTGQMPPYTAKALPDATLTDIYAFLQSLPAPKAPDSIPLLK